MLIFSLRDSPIMSIDFIIKLFKFEFKKKIMIKKCLNRKEKKSQLNIVD